MRTLARLTGAFARLPIRVRLVLVFTLVMAAVLAATGAFLYLRLGAALDDNVDRGLRTRAHDVAALVDQAGPGSGMGAAGLALRGGDFVQIVSSDGAVLDGTAPRSTEPLLTSSELVRAAESRLWLERAVPGSDEPAQLLATPAGTGANRLIVVVGTSLEGRGEALESLLTQLLIGIPLALLLSSLAAYWLAGAALRPVESMRREAEAVSGSEADRRLPLPAAHDEIHRLGETLNSMLERLEVALARERRLVADASHELRTPLATMHAELELALRRPRTKEELEQALRSVMDETERLSRLADDLLVLARSHGWELPVRRERLAASELLDGVRARYDGRTLQAGLGLTVATDPGLALDVDRLRAEQAIGNLVENSLRYARTRIELCALRRDGGVELHVRDDGPGFPPGLLEHAFEPFRRGERGGGAAGLGLTIVDVIARAHGGATHVAVAGGWTDVWIELPDAVAERPD